MIILASTSDKLQVISSAAAALDVHASWLDNASGTVSSNRTNTAITTATTTDVVPSPASGVQRNLKTLHIRNKHANNSCDVTVQHTDGTIVSQLHKVTLSPGMALQYIDELGFALAQLALAGSVGGLVQEVYAENTAYSTASATMAGGQDTIPQQTDGTQILSATITPRSASNTLRFEIFIPLSFSLSSYFWLALFQDATAAAIASTLGYTVASNPNIVSFAFEMPAGTLASTTFKVRLGQFSGGSGTIAINGIGGSRLLGGSQRATLSIKEFAPTPIAVASAPPGVVLLNILTANNSAVLTDTTSITSAYDDYEIQVSNLVPAVQGTAQTFTMQVFIGGSWITTGYNVLVAGGYQAGTGGAGSANDGTTGLSGFMLAGYTNFNPIATTANRGLSGVYRLHRVNGADMKMLTGTAAWWSSGTNPIDVASVGGLIANTGVITGIRFQHAAGNIASGTICVRGLRTN